MDRFFVSVELTVVWMVRVSLRLGIIGLVVGGLASVGGLAPASAQELTLDVDAAKTYQTMTGWGGHVYPQTWRFHADDPSYESKLFDELDVTHIRLRSVWYLLEGENDNGDPNVIDMDAIARGDTGIVHDELLLQQRIAERGKIIQFASWRFPYWMAGRDATWNPQPDEKPPLRPEMEDEYVESMAAYMLYARDQYGIRFDAVSIANEPDIGIYITELTPERLLSISRKLADRLTREGYELDATGATAVKFYMPDIAAADSIGLDYAKRFFQLPGASEFADALSYHSYRRDTDVMRALGALGRDAGIEVWAMEQSHTHLAAFDRFEWSHALSNAACLFDVLVHTNATLSLYWSLAMSSSGGLGLYVPEKQTWAPAYDMLKHFYNFIPPGSVRIDAALAHSIGADQSASSQWLDEAGGQLLVVAFKRPDDAVVAVLINTTGSDRRVTVNGNWTDVDAYVSDPIWQGFEGEVNQARGAPVLKLPARSLVTLTLTK